MPLLTILGTFFLVTAVLQFLLPSMRWAVVYPAHCLCVAYLGFWTLFIVASISADIAYSLMRLAMPAQMVWTAASCRQWAIVWAATWLAQLPLWWYVLGNESLLLAYGEASIVLYVYRVLLNQLGSLAAALPSIASFRSHHHSRGFCVKISVGHCKFIVQSRKPKSRWHVCGEFMLACLLPLSHAIISGLPHDERRRLFTYFLMHVADSCILLHAVLMTNMSPVKFPSWIKGMKEMKYPHSHGSLVPQSGGNSAGSDLTTENDAFVDVCPICLQHLNCQDGGSMAATVHTAISRSMAPGLSVARRWRGLASAGIAAARTPPGWIGGLVATTRCNHKFHASCLSMAVKMTRQCPACRTELTIPGGDKVHGEDREDVSPRIVCVSFGLQLAVLSLLGMKAIHAVR
eukprot:gnl/TRDRNA2_/TRDRNA2_161547_c0_seq2.p1 gnl/TRDRNA2_/TRDRNA2_161547_c0~~gnl/TRDRNA2_/TRDRNA2_161547_c0_seq2.p1  ORF type:complete len:403 (+),score=26.66 gnl/TRDRNA2_/TRDRNA2_161547_c0_seq2:60-1268(+)